MEQFIGVKVIKAKPMTRGEYNGYRGWQIPENEDPAEKGYLVEYVDSPNSVHPNHENYISWSPADVFEEAYRKTSGMTFGLAIEAVKKGLNVARKGWNGKGQFIYMITASDLQKALKYGYGEYIGEPTVQPALAIKTSANQIQVGWLASQTDMLAEDWYIVE